MSRPLRMVQLLLPSEIRRPAAPAALPLTVSAIALTALCAGLWLAC